MTSVPSFPSRLYSVGYIKAKVGEHRFQRNGVVMLAPFIRLGHCQEIFLGEWLIVDGSQGELARKRIEHRLQQTFKRRQLHGAN